MKVIKEKTKVFIIVDNVKFVFTKTDRAGQLCVKKYDRHNLTPIEIIPKNGNVIFIK